MYKSKSSSFFNFSIAFIQQYYDILKKKIIFSGFGAFLEKHKKSILDKNSWKKSFKV